MTEGRDIEADWAKLWEPGGSDLVGCWDVGWYLEDEVGHVAFLTTAGGGPLPRVLLQDRSAFDRLDAFFEELPPGDLEPVLKEGVGGVRTDWIEGGRRGFFGYDWLDAHRSKNKVGKYERILVPARPLSTKDLPQEVLIVLSQYRLRGQSFRDGEPLDLSSIECVD